MNLKKKILATLLYYDIFDWPLRINELTKFSVNLDFLDKFIPSHYTRHALAGEGWGQGGASWQGRALQNALQKELDWLFFNQIIGSSKGFYFLIGREHIVPLRLKKEKIAKRKWQLARRAVCWLRFAPYVRAVFASGSLAMNNTDELSDLDVLIVVKHRRIWLARFLVLAILSLLGMRRKAGDKIAPDKICPNHFITDKSLRIPYQSIYTAQTYINLVPLYTSRPELLQEFKRANNWMLNYVDGWNFNFQEEETLKKKLILNKSWVSSVSQKIIECLLDALGIGRVLENWLRNYQSRRIIHGLSRRQVSGHIVFNNSQLAFHPSSIEGKVLNNYVSRLLKMKRFKIYF